MIQSSEVEQYLKAAFPNARISVSDTTGTGDHFELQVVWKGFFGKPLIDQHRLVQQALQGPLDDGRIHAIKVKTEIPGPHQKSSVQNDGLQILE